MLSHVRGYSSARKEREGESWADRIVTLNLGRSSSTFCDGDGDGVEKGSTATGTFQNCPACEGSKDETLVWEYGFFSITLLQ